MLSTLWLCLFHQIAVPPNEDSYYVDLSARWPDVRLLQWSKLRGWRATGFPRSAEAKATELEPVEPVPTPPIWGVNRPEIGFGDDPSRVALFELEVWLSSAISTKCTLDEFSAWAREQPYAAALDDTEVFLRWAVALGRVDVVDRSSVLLFRLSAEAQKSHARRRYLASLGAALSAQQDQLVGVVSHGPTTGEFREHLVRSFLRRHVPRKYSVSTGFVDQCARQIDVLVWDSGNFSPLYEEGELAVVPYDSVQAVIEVKSTINERTLPHALKLLHDLPTLREVPFPVFKGVLAFKNDRATLGPLVRRIRTYYKNPEHVGHASWTLGTLHEQFTAIAVVDGAYVERYYEFDSQDQSVVPMLAAIVPSADRQSSSMARFFARLFAHLDLPEASKANQRRIDAEMPLLPKDSMVERLTDADWLDVRPQFLDVDRHGIDVADWAQISQSWSYGGVSTKTLRAYTRSAPSS